MDFVDSATGTAQRGHGAAVRGAQETDVGVANMESRAPAATATAPATAAGPGATGGTVGTKGSAPPPVPPGSSTGF